MKMSAMLNLFSVSTYYKSNKYPPPYILLYIFFVDDDVICIFAFTFWWNYVGKLGLRIGGLRVMNFNRKRRLLVLSSSLKCLEL